jgi:extracellular factor (EF) 3-hydroxypalmitic acid methyl ester biosynthesis protein
MQAILKIIDRMYRQHISNDEKFKKWDAYYNSHIGSMAARNRKTYFIDLLNNLEINNPNNAELNVLNIASGSGRDMQEFFIQKLESRIFIDCIERDVKAINFAQNLCSNWLSQIRFQNANAVKFRTNERYNFIWSAGLFDYVSDKTFKFMLKRYFSMLKEDGEMVIGNFSENNSSRYCMEILGDWYLNHRSKEKLIELAQECDLPTSSITVGQEPLGVNLFLHIKK